jgi:transcriptional regulator with XRE-family HTH domain
MRFRLGRLKTINFGRGGVRFEGAGMQMTIGERLRKLRKEKKLFQKDIGQRTGLPQSYLSQVENGHTTPGIQTLEKLTRALGIPMHQLFHDGDHPSQRPEPSNGAPVDDPFPSHSGLDSHFLNGLHQLLRRIDESDRNLLFSIALEMACRSPQLKARQRNSRSVVPNLQDAET